MWCIRENHVALDDEHLHRNLTGLIFLRKRLFERRLPGRLDLLRGVRPKLERRKIDILPFFFGAAYDRIQRKSDVVTAPGIKLRRNRYSLRRVIVFLSPMPAIRNLERDTCLRGNPSK